MRAAMRLALLTVFVVGSCACTTGEGEGRVWSEQLYIENCWNGPFELQPTFFGANPYREESLLIRVQRGDNQEEVSDGLMVVVNDIQAIRGNDLGAPIDVGLPPGVTPSGVSLAGGAEPPLVSLALYLHATCHAQNGTVYAIGGSITFDSLFSGDINEPDGDDRLTDATFENVVFADPRQMASDRSIDPGQTSMVHGNFRFFFQRGQPAQPFP